MNCNTKNFKNMRSFNQFAPIFANILHDVIQTPVSDIAKEKEHYTVPAANVTETATHFEIVMAIPGFKKEDLTIKVEKNTLSIEGNKTVDTPKYKHKEFNLGKIKRSFNLSNEINKEDIKASVDMGLLTIKLAKAEVTQPTNVEIL